MASRYKLLPASANHVEIARICRECIRQMQDERISYEDFVARVNNSMKDKESRLLSLASLKTFMTRHNVKRLNTNNLTVELVYNYILEYLDSLSEEVKAIIMGEWATFSPASVASKTGYMPNKRNIDRSISALFCKWVNTSEMEIERIKTKISGKYIMLRKSVNDKDVIVKSNIEIGLSKLPAHIDIVHSHTDRMGVERRAEGFLVPIVRNLYCFMEIENGEGLDILAIKEPIQQNFKRIIGFLVSMNIDRKILSAHIFLEKNDEAWENVPPRFKAQQVKENEAWNHLIGRSLIKLLDSETAPTIKDAIVDENIERVMNP